MKRIICLILATMMLSIPVYAADIDVASLSDDELKALQVKVNDEIHTRHLDGSAIVPLGTYYVGKDIEAGTYLAEDDDPDDPGSIIFIYNDEDAYNTNTPSETYQIWKGQSARIPLDDGWIMKVMSAPTSLRIAEDLPFAPETE